MKSKDFLMFKSGNSAFCIFCEDLDSIGIQTYDVTYIFNFITKKFNEEYYDNEEIQIHLIDTISTICDYRIFDQNSESVHKITSEILLILKTESIEMLVDPLCCLLNLPKFNFYKYKKEIFEKIFIILKNNILNSNKSNLSDLLRIHLSLFMKYGIEIENLTSGNYLEIIFNFSLKNNSNEIRGVSNEILYEIFSYKTIRSKNFVDKLLLTLPSKEYLNDIYEM